MNAEQKHTTYFTSKSRVLSLSLRGPTSVALALLTSLVAYLMAYSLAMREGPSLGILIALGGIAVFAAEAFALEFAWGRGYQFISIRRLSTAYTASNIAWIVVLIPAAVLGKPSLAVYSVFPFWAVRAYVIGAVFSPRNPRALSALLSTALAPLYNLILDVQRIGLESVLPMSLGFPLLAVAGASLALLERGRVSGLAMLSAFLEAWSGSNGDPLESLMSELGDDGPARGYLVRTSKFVLAVPYVHPGPFRPVGSYNVPGRLAGELRRNMCGAVLHGAVDHNRNLASGSDTRKFTSGMALAALDGGFEGGSLSTVVTAAGRHVRLRGIWIGSSALLLIVEPVDGLEDYGDAVVARAEELGKKYGVKVILADAHNSLGPDPGEEEVAELLSLAEEVLRKGPPGSRIVRCGCASRPGVIWPDIGSAGVAAIVLEDDVGRRLAMIVADSNNAVPGFREKLGERLRSAGFSDYILCTTDTHETTGISDARRGYSALGEVEDGLMEVIEGVVQEALERLGPCGESGAKEFTVHVKFAGAGFLGTSRDITSRSIRIAKATVLVAVAFAIAGYVVLAII